MKKFIFSAIGVVAFVGSSMASNEVEKNVIMLNNDNDCLNVYSSVSTYAKNQGATEEQTNRIAMIARQACWDAMGSMEPKKLSMEKIKN